VSEVTESSYELVTLIGEGGMGRVYRAVHRPSGRVVAVKMLRSEARDDVGRRRLLLDEATAAARLAHPNIVALLDVGRDPHGSPYLVMELVEGFDLSTWVRAWPGWSTIARALDDILAGLAEAHAAGIVHRDLKPENFLVDRATERVKIVDFGIARVLDPLRGEAGRASIAGTPVYMAPEQFVGVERIGPWTDLYALGVIIHELLAGTPPFPYEPTASIAAKLHGEAPPLRVRNGLDLPPELARLFHSMIAREPRDRPRFAAEVRARLAEFAAQVGDSVFETERAEVHTAPTYLHDEATDRGTLEAPLSVAPRASAPPRSARPSAPPEAEPAGARTPTLIELPFELAAAGEANPGRALRRVREAPLIARAQERATILAQALDVRSNRLARLLVFIGPPGVGKSRVARWGFAEVERSGAMESLAAGYDVSETELAGGLRRALRRAIGLPSTAPTADVPPAEWRWLAAADGRLPFDASLLHRWLAEDIVEAGPVEPVVDALAGAVGAMARVRPVYLWLDDVAWARDGAMELLERLLDAPNTPVLAVVTLREGTAQHPRLAARFEKLFARPLATVRHMAPLDAGARRELLGALAPLGPELVEGLATSMDDGTPLTLVQIVHGLADAGLLEPGPDGLRPAGGRTVEQLLALHPLGELTRDRVREVIDTFGPDSDRAEGVLARAAVLGVQFEEGALRAASGADEPLVDQVLDRVLLHGLVRAEGSGRYSFDHRAVQEHLLARIQNLVDRETVLRETADGLFAFYGRVRADVAVRAALLLRRAGELERAYDTIFHAVRAFGRAFETQRALAELDTARRWLTEDGVSAPDARLAELTMNEGYVAYFALRYDDALAALAEAEQHFATLGDDVMVARCRCFVASVWFYQDRFRDSERRAKESIAEASKNDPRRAVIGLFAGHILAQHAALRGDFEAALCWQLDVSEYAAASGKLWREAFALLKIADLELILGRADDAQRHFDEAMQGIHDVRYDELLGEALEVEARLALARGRAADLRPRLTAHVRAVESRNELWALTSLRLTEARLSAALDDAPTAAAAARRFLQACRAVNHDEPPTLAGIRALADALDALGEHAPATELREHLALRTTAYDARDTQPENAT
jgi:tetratricopeptide (TPR) repeat protein